MRIEENERISGNKRTESRDDRGREEEEEEEEERERARTNSFAERRVESLVLRRVHEYCTSPIQLQTNFTAVKQ